MSDSSWTTCRPIHFQALAHSAALLETLQQHEWPMPVLLQYFLHAPTCVVPVLELLRTCLKNAASLYTVIPYSIFSIASVIAAAPGAAAKLMLAALGGPTAKVDLVNHLTTAVAAYLTTSSATWAQRLQQQEGLVAAWMAAAVDNWLEMDLFAAGVRFLKNARGSFGLGLMCSLDCDR